jgi:tight junction protein 1
MQNGCNVIGSARGIIDYYGGKLSCPLTGVSLFIPTGAIPEGIEQEIYFQVCQDSSHIEKFDGQLLSPIVICGPQGIRFDKAVELILPHSAGNDAQQLSLILHGTNQSKFCYKKYLIRSFY